MTTACPTCGKPVDTLRARHVGVRAGKVVAYCSAECEALAAAAEARGLAEDPKLRAAGDAKAAAKGARTPPTGVRAVRTPATGVAVAQALYESGPVIEILRDPVSGATKGAGAPAGAGAARADGAGAGAIDAGAGATDPEAPPSASGIRRIRRRKDAADANSAWEWIDEEPADPTAATGDDEAAPPRRRGLAIVLALALALLGGGGYLAYRFVLAPGPGPAPEPVRADAAIVSIDAPAPTPEQERKAALDRATAVLRGLVESGPPLVRRAAAGALSRTGDAKSIEVLAAALAAEPSESGKLELAYQLARAGDARGPAKLVAALEHPIRDTRFDAASRLARLGDRRGVPTLTGAMAYGQFRLSAATELAHLAEPAALKILEQVVRDPNASADDKARATIALGRARRAGETELRALLADKRNAEAAPVLAALGDATAKPVLHEQLGFEHVRVEAARSLRRIGDDGDLRDGLRTLLAALAADQATAQVRAAEAILLLAGPASWSERM